jgi:NAD(P)-dependent dehydrogenase (short-subunit alcohol dehydrogenase family)
MDASATPHFPSGSPLDLFRLDDRVVIVTGASSGLGRRFARVVDAAGARVVLAARRRDRLEELAAELRDAHVVQADLGAADGPATVVEAALEAFGAIDVVVNNAGSSRVAAALDYDRTQLAEDLAINLMAPYEIARLSARAMIDAGTGGSIINIGSVLGAVAGGKVKVPGYAAAKGGLHQLTRELASEWARKGIRVNALAPAWFETEMTGDEMFGTDAGQRYIIDGTPMGRAGREHELDGALLFLAGEASSYVTGHVLFVDGGWTAI